MRHGPAAVRAMGSASALPKGWLNRWSVATLLALLGVLLVFVDVLLTVEVQRVSFEANRLRARLEELSPELGAMRSQWASRSSHAELDSRAAELGLVVPRRDQVVLLPESFAEEGRLGEASDADKLRPGLVDAWTQLAAMGIP